MLHLPPYDEVEARRDPAVRLRPAFEMAVEEIRPQLLARFPAWRDIPRLRSHDDAFAARMSAVSSGKSERVDFKRMLARFMKSRFAEYQLAGAMGSLHRYAKALDADLALGVDWLHKAAWGLGKMMQVEVGARWGAKAAVLSRTLPNMLGSGDPVDWEYTTKEDLEACLDGAATFLDVALPALADALPNYMPAGVDLGGAGAITAREAYAIAQRLAGNGTQLVSLTCVFGTGKTWGPEISSHGRLRAHGMWMFVFSGALQGAWIFVPSLGAPVVYRLAGGKPRTPPIVEAWIDSDTACEALVNSGRLPPGATVFRMTLSNEQYFNASVWRIDLAIPGALPRVAILNPSDGAIVWMSP